MFIPRHPVVENQFCKYGATTTAGGSGDVIAYAGAVVYLDAAATNEETIVKLMDTDQVPFGFLMQKVKTGYHNVHPVGMVLPGDLGSSDAIAQPVYDASGAITGTDEVPVGVAHLGIWDTVHYTVDTKGTDKMAPGETLVTATAAGKVTNGTGVNSTSVARVVKGASAAKVEANIDNTTLFPIRVKLLV
jgi:hypothetical protein